MNMGKGDVLSYPLTTTKENERRLALMREARTRDYRRNWAKGGSNYKRKEGEETEGEKQGGKNKKKQYFDSLCFYEINL